MISYDIHFSTIIYAPKNVLHDIYNYNHIYPSVITKTRAKTIHNNTLKLITNFF